MRISIALLALFVMPLTATGGGVEVCDCNYPDAVTLSSGVASGTVTNDSDREVCFLRVEVYFADKSGNIQKSATVYCTPHTIAPGESASFSFDIPEDIPVDHHHTRLDVRYRYR